MVGFNFLYGLSLIHRSLSKLVFGRNDRAHSNVQEFKKIVEISSPILKELGSPCAVIKTVKIAVIAVPENASSAAFFASANLSQSFTF